MEERLFFFLPAHQHAFGRKPCLTDDLRLMGLPVENLGGQLILRFLPEGWKKSVEGKLTFFYQLTGGRWVLKFFVTEGSVCFL